MFFKKFIIAIFIATSSLFLFVMIIRLGNNKKGLLGVSDLISYVETRDLSKPLKNFSNSIETLTTSWKDFFDSFNNYTDNSFNSSGRDNGKTPNKFQEFFNSLGKAFSNVGNNLKTFYFALLTTITFPVQLLVDIAILIGNGFKEFYLFINWITTFEGYPQVTFS